LDGTACDRGTFLQAPTEKKPKKRKQLTEAELKSFADQALKVISRWKRWHRYTDTDSHVFPP